MRVRLNFVSNSSSSSFICDVCGETVTGFGMSLHESEMYQCENEHLFCFAEAISEPDKDEESEYIKSVHCPICNFIEMCNRDVGRYLQKTTDISRDSVFAEIKSVNKRRKKLKDHEYVENVCIKISTTTQDILKELKDKYTSYDQFLKDIK